MGKGAAAAACLSTLVSNLQHHSPRTPRCVEYQGARGGRACADTKATSLTNELAFKPSLIGYSSASLKAKEAHAVACSKREIASATYLSTKSMSFCDSRISLCRNATKW